MKRCTSDHQVRIAADPVVGFGGWKAPSSIGKLSPAEVLRLRATSAVSLDQSVRRSAQDDEFVEGLNTTGSICRKHEKIAAEVLRLRATSAVSLDPSVRRSAQDDDFAGRLEYNWFNMQKTRKDRKSHSL